MYGQSYTYQIQQADSLFERGDFTGSLKLYEQILSQSGKASPGILLKMAYIYEGLEDYTQALYYLSVYYSFRPSQQAIDQMKNIASRHNLTGYEFKDADFFMVLYERYYVYITSALMLICTILLASMIGRKLRRQYVPSRHMIGLILFLIIVFAFLNITFRYKSVKAIIAHDNVYLMSAPSAGASLISILPKGHRLDINNQQDIWLEIVWNEQIAYVRQQNVLMIE
ncbi:tetratricopeptide repeat protein [Rhodocytophaga rosea]|uniref:Tetratricopeptide repeat protein n=1 Tax=Rhodocytophaga rosea TaxID=2704465 RepID=A0A6C0GL62_9BACT|nr:tetratricopeptide repeat protein [Rhodocytophaga rosea]QHT68719.1 tetratricopeptide repeat protein [Rhodocytophaga rosea]